MVYLLPLASLVLSVYLKRSMISEEGAASITNTEEKEADTPVDPEVAKYKRGINAVSYTHLDVYKRQIQNGSVLCRYL